MIGKSSIVDFFKTHMTSRFSFKQTQLSDSWAVGFQNQDRQIKALIVRQFPGGKETIITQPLGHILIHGVLKPSFLADAHYDLHPFASLGLTSSLPGKTSPSSRMM